ncbi:MAG TPA: glycogen debranching protein, partial [Candidatus Marinimicrobia bacterium]|nr:glycogen debranching protein [Candidatus Neomarinimicrobiota bacterium]
MFKYWFLAGLLMLLTGCGQDALYRSDTFSIHPASVRQGVYTATVLSEDEIVSDYVSPDRDKDEIPAEKIHWRRTRSLDRYPEVLSNIPLVNAMTRMSLEELQLNIREDSTFMAGAKWTGVWTRDISYSILLSLAFLEPEISKKSLMTKVKDGRIIQDTGTGGSWPVSTDRMTWALAAWEIYTATGDLDWLRQVYPIIARSAAEDEAVAVNPKTGLFYGESSFLDWREQTYPRWMDPVDIYRSQCLGTNAVHYQTLRILASMADILGEKPDEYLNRANKIKKAVNTHLWSDSRGWYGQFLYGRHYQSLSEKPEALGEALSLLFGIADESRSRSILENMPVGSFGIPCIYPQIPHIPPYHNNGIWPFVVAYWTWAAADMGHIPHVEHGMASIYRAAALFGTNKENFVAKTGDYIGTEINSDRQLWSVAGNLAMVYRVLAGIRLDEKALTFKPVIPPGYGDTLRIINFPYRKALLDIEIFGTGTEIHSIELDGNPLTEAQIPETVTGFHHITIHLANKQKASEPINTAPWHAHPDTPILRYEKKTILWEPLPGTEFYEVFVNGSKKGETTDCFYKILDQNHFTEYQVRAVDKKGWTSFLSEPLTVIPGSKSLTVDVSGDDIQRDYRGYKG